MMCSKPSVSMRSKKRNNWTNKLREARRLWSRHRISDPVIEKLRNLGMIMNFRGETGLGSGNGRNVNETRYRWEGKNTQRAECSLSHHQTCHDAGLSRGRL